MVEKCALIASGMIGIVDSQIEYGSPNFEYFDALLSLSITEMILIDNDIYVGTNVGYVLKFTEVSFSIFFIDHYCTCLHCRFSIENNISLTQSGCVIIMKKAD